MSAKPTTTNARYRVVEFRRGKALAVFDGGTMLGVVMRPLFKGTRHGYCVAFNGSYETRNVDNEAAAMDALVAAYEATLGSGEAGE